MKPIPHGCSDCPGGWKPYYIDGFGKVHCGCRGSGYPRSFFDLRFKCGENHEYASYTNFLDVKKTFCTLRLRMANIDEDLTEDQEDAIDEWAN